MFKSIKRFIKRRKLSRLKRNTRFFIPTPSKWMIVVPFRFFSLVIIVALLLTAGYFFLRSDFFLIKNVKISYQGGVSGSEEFANGLIGEEKVAETIEPQVLAHALWSVNTGSLEKSVMEIDKSIKEVQIGRKLPDTLLVSVVERKPVLQFVIELQEQKDADTIIQKKSYYLIDDTGEIFFEANKDMGLPVFTYPVWEDAFRNNSEEINDQRIPATVVQALVSFATELDTFETIAPTNYILEETYSLRIETDKDITFVVELQKDVKKQLFIIQSVLQQSVLTGKDIEYIDTRFDKSVVRYR